MHLCVVLRAVNYVLLLVQPKCQGEMSFIQVDLYAQDRLCLEPLQSVPEFLWKLEMHTNGPKGSDRLPKVLTQMLFILFVC
jgi:hypothetical protein